MRRGKRSVSRQAGSDHRRTGAAWRQDRLGRIDWEWPDREIAALCSDMGRPGIASRFLIELLPVNQRDRSSTCRQTTPPDHLIIHNSR